MTTTPTPTRMYSLTEVAKHNTADSLWTVVRGQVLDLTAFAKKHPGGAQIILAAGIDSTILVDSYHPKDLPKQLLDRLVIGQVSSPLPSFYVMDNRPEAFYPTLKRRVHEHLRALGVERRGSTEIHVKAAFYLCTLVVSYVLGWVLAWNSEENPYLPYLFAIIHGAAAAHVGMSIMHDANHGAFSKSRTVNTIMGHGLDLIGASGCVWSFQHVVSHHAFTNLETRTERNLQHHRNLQPGQDAKDDADIQLSHENDVDVFSSFPMVRMHPADERHWFHRYQHLYAPVLFGFFTMVKIIYSDIAFFLTTRVSHVDMTPRMSWWGERVIFLAFKVFNFVMMIALPTYLHGFLFAMKMLFTAHFVAGEYLAICFIVSHISEDALFYQGGAQLNIPGAEKLGNEAELQKLKVHPRDWAARQATSTVNWAVESWFWGAFSGGLNTQLEHHLFPGVNHTAYRFMPPVVREVCKEFNVPYVEVPNLFQAVVLCLRYLRDLGIEDNPGKRIVQ